MRINSIFIGNFGGITNLKLNFDNNFNLIYGKNEAGKSTIQSFIKAMLYGMNSSKKSIRENDRKRFLPWNGKKAYGELTFEDATENKYVIKRSFGVTKKEDDCEVYNAISGDRIVHIDTNNIGKEILGISEEAFERTLLIKQLGSEVIRDKEDEIMQKLTNLKQTGDAQVSFHKAMRILEEGKKALSGIRKNGKLDDLRLNYDALLEEKIESNSLQESILEKHLEMKELRELKAELIKNIHKLEAEKEIIKKDDIESFETESLIEKLGDLGAEQQIEEINKKINELKWAISELDEELKSFKGFNELDTDIERKVIALDREINDLELSIKEVRILKTELSSLSSNVKTETEALTKLKNFSRINEELEAKISLQEALIKEKEIGENKNKPAKLIKESSFYIILLLMGSIMIFLGASMRPNMKILSYISMIGGALLILLSLMKILATFKQVDYEYNKAKTFLSEVYSEIGIRNYEEFIKSISDYRELKENIDKLNIQLETKRSSLEKIDLENLEQRLSKSLRYIEFIFNHCAVEDVDSLITKLNNYKSLKEEKIKKESNLDNIKSSLKSLIIEIIDKTLKEENNKLLTLEKEITALESYIEYSFKQQRMPSLVEEEIAVTKEKIISYEKQMKALALAQEILNEAFLEIQKSFGPLLNKEVGEILAYITEGKYSKILVSGELDVKLIENERNYVKEVDYFSNGTWDQIYFALRMAIIKIILPQESLKPLIFDDAFIQYDEDRLAKVLEFLRNTKENLQIILFTCQKREEAVMKTLGLDYYSINLEA